MSGFEAISLKVVARFALLLAVFVAPWPGFSDAYGAVAGFIGNAVLGVIDTRAVTLHFEHPHSSSATTAFGIVLTAQSRATGALVHVPVDLRTLAYLPAAAFAALAIAAPIWADPRRGWRVLLGGLGILHVFLAASIFVPLLLFFSQEEPLKIVDLSAWVRDTLDVFYRSTVAPPGMAYAIPLMLFLVLTLVTDRPARVEEG